MVEPSWGRAASFYSLGEDLCPSRLQLVGVRRWREFEVDVPSGWLILKCAECNEWMASVRAEDKASSPRLVTMADGPYEDGPGNREELRAPG